MAAAARRLLARVLFGGLALPLDPGVVSGSLPAACSSRPGAAFPSTPLAVALVRLRVAANPQGDAQKRAAGRAASRARRRLQSHPPPTGARALFLRL